MLQTNLQTTFFQPFPPETIEKSEFMTLTEFVEVNETTVFVRVAGDGFPEYGIFERDLLIVSQNRPPISGDIVLCKNNGNEFCIRIFKHRLTIAGHQQPLDVWGIVTHVIHPTKGEN